ncbi:MAG: LD-carboxypeptidase [Flavobacteriales bacterium]|nr:LD-carboxypeptidase [Flavobacteriales bacterium]
MKRLTLLLAINIILTMCATAQKINKVPHYNKMIRPEYIKKGDTVAVMALSSRVNIKDMNRVNATLDTLRGWGVTVKLSPHVFSQDGGHFSVPDSVRAADFMQLIEDPSVKAIIMYRGGYGAMRTFDYIDFKKVRKNPKWVVGYSDVTALHYAMNRVGVESILGEMPTSFSRDTTVVDTSAASLRDALFGTLKEIKTSAHHYNNLGKASGRVIGGNLTLICAAMDTDVDNILKKDEILVIEEVGETISNVDAMMLTLWRSGRLARAKAVLVGHFTNCPVDDWGMSIYDMIYSYTKRLNVPVVFDYPSGHEEPNYSLYVGRKANLKVDENGSVLTFE